MRDIILGARKRTWSSASAVVTSKNIPVSENRQLYWCSEEYTNTRIWIVKESPEGKKFKKFLEKHIDNPMIVKKYLLQIAIEHMDANVFLSIYHEQFKSGEEDGYEKCQKDLRKVIGVCW